jgi:hypothetical protein
VSRLISHSEAHNHFALERFRLQLRRSSPTLLPARLHFTDSNHEHRTSDEILSPVRFETSQETYEVPRIDGRDGSKGSVLDDKIHSFRNIPQLALADVPLIDPVKTTDVSTNMRHLTWALRTGKPSAILQATVTMASNPQGGIELVPSSTFSEVLQCLDPDHFVTRYARLQLEFSPGLAELMGISPQRFSDGLNHWAVLFMSYVHTITEARIAAGRPLSLQDYRLLLNFARSVGDKNASRSLWKSMEIHGIEPDLDCYNHYMSNLVWGELLNNQQRHRVRVTAMHLYLRQGIRKPRDAEGGFEGHRVGDGGIKMELTQIFATMIKSGVVGDEQSFCSMMIAMAREGDMKALENILRRVWNVDVERLVKRREYRLESGYDDENLQSWKKIELSPVVNYAEDSPFRPSQRLLFTIAHAYGINNAIPQALLVVDYISREYSLDVSRDVWAQLLERTVVLCTKRSNQKKKFQPCLYSGQLPHYAVMDLWTTMTSEPYNVRPTLDMYNKVITHLLIYQSLGKAQDLMDEAHPILLEILANYSRHLRLWELCVKTWDIKPLTRQQLHRDLLFQRAVMQRGCMYFQRWAKRFLKMQAKTHNNQDLSYRNLPQFVEKWARYLPSVIQYEIPGGQVTLDNPNSKRTRLALKQAAPKSAPKRQLRNR